MSYPYNEDDIRDILSDVLRHEREEQTEELGTLIIPPMEEKLNESDIVLLEDSVVNLFDTLDRRENLFEILTVLATKIWRYRIDQESQPIIDSFKPKRYTKKSPDKKIEDFKKRVDDVLSLMGHRMTLKTQEASELMTALQNAYDNPQDYIGMSIMKEGNTKHPVKEYFESLKIEGKKEIINEFIELLH